MSTAWQVGQDNYVPACSEGAGYGLKGLMSIVMSAEDMRSMWGTVASVSVLPQPQAAGVVQRAEPQAMLLGPGDSSTAQTSAQVSQTSTVTFLTVPVLEEHLAFTTRARTSLDKMNNRKSQRASLVQRFWGQFYRCFCDLSVNRLHHQTQFLGLWKPQNCVS